MVIGWFISFKLVKYPAFKNAHAVPNEWPTTINEKNCTTMNKYNWLLCNIWSNLPKSNMFFIKTSRFNIKTTDTKIFLDLFLPVIFTGKYHLRIWNCIFCVCSIISIRKCTLPWNLYLANNAISKWWFSTSFWYVFYNHA